MLVEPGAGEVQLISCVRQTLYFTSQIRKDRVVMKVAMLGRSSCRPEGDTGQKLSLVQKLGWGTVMVSISISPGSHCCRRLRSLVAISCLSSLDSLGSNREKTASSPDRKVTWCSLFSRAAVAITGLSFLIPLSRWIVVRRFKGALGKE